MLDDEIKIAIAEKIRHEELAKKIAEEHQVDFDKLFFRLPGDLPPGMPFTTARRMCELGITSYREVRIYTLFKQDQIPGSLRIGSKLIVFNADAVQSILERERQRTTGQLILPGNKPGIRFP